MEQLEAAQHAVLGAIFLPLNPAHMLADAISGMKEKLARSSARGVSFAGAEVISRPKVQELLVAETRALAPFALMKDEPRPVGYVVGIAELFLPS